MNILESIVQYDIAHESTEGAYNTLVYAAVEADCYSKDTWILYTQPAEDEYMTRFHNEPESRKKDGTWKYRTYLPSAYSSAKSVIGSALDLNLPLIGENGKPMGKSALQNAIKSAKDGTTGEKTRLDKVNIMLDSIKKLAQSADSGERLSILWAIDAAHMEVERME
jgi:hypothetical protein